MDFASTLTLVQALLNTSIETNRNHGTKKNIISIRTHQTFLVQLILFLSVKSLIEMVFAPKFYCTWNFIALLRSFDPRLQAHSAQAIYLHRTKAPLFVLGNSVFLLKHVRKQCCRQFYVAAGVNTEHAFAFFSLP